MYIQSQTNHKSRRSQDNAVRMVHHATRGHAFVAQYDAAVQDPIKAASMRTELVDLLIPQDDNRGSKVSIVRPPVRAHIITNTWATKKKYDTSPAFVLMASDRFIMWTLIRTQLKLQHLQ